MPRAQKATETAKQAPAKKTASAAKKEATPKKVAAVKTDGGAAKKTPAKAAKAATKPATKAASAGHTRARAKDDHGDHDHDGPQDKFLHEQRTLLLEERAEYVAKAEELKAEADTLAAESEPGDIQFDEEGGEGNTSNVEREVDLVLSAQARAAVDEIDRALAKIDAGTYGICEKCGKPIPHARLKALPYAALCVQCKSGGLSRR